MKIDKEKKIAYLAHPTDPLEVKKAREAGLEIIDIRFAPETPSEESAKDGGAAKAKAQ